MLPPIAAAIFGAMLAQTVDVSILAVHSVAIFAAVYTAHVKDGYVDFHLRGEDDEHPLTPYGSRMLLGFAGIVFWLLIVVLYLLAGPLAVALTVPGWFIGFFHAPQLDTTTVGVTGGYPFGIGLCLLGGYAAQAAMVPGTVVGLAVALVVMLVGIKIIDDGTDIAYDRSIGKPTVAVLVGRHRARELGLYAMWVGGIGILWLVGGGYLPPGAGLAPAVFVPIALVALQADDETATMLLIRGMYLVLAVLVVAVWYEPFAGVGLPDITVFGPYTYLLTEIFFGSIAFGLLIYLGAVKTALRTILAVYPLAYVWDWYSLAVGIFAIPMRTGIELFGIPLEEHIFMIVVPAMVIAVHELLARRDERRVPPPRRQSTE